MKLRTIFVLILVFTLGGCATPGVKYYWGNYSETLYTLKAKPSAEAEQRHIDELLKIISKSDEKGFRVPPGVQAELGFRYAQQGDAEKASGHFQAELAAYPESRLFIEKMQGMGSK
jgi:hypothetical protein